MGQPSREKALTVDPYLGGLPKDGYPTRSEYFIEGTEPKDVSPFYKKLKISRTNGKLANDVEIRSGNYDEKEFIVITENDPVSTDGSNRWQEAIDAWAREQGDEKFHYPTEGSTESSDSVVVSFKSPSDKQKIDNNNVEVNVRITSIESIKSAKLYVDGSEVKSYSGDREEIKETLNVPDGVHELKVEVTNEKDKTAESKIKIGVKTEVVD